MAIKDRPQYKTLNIAIVNPDNFLTQEKKDGVIHKLISNKIHIEAL